MTAGPDTNWLSRFDRHLGSERRLADTTRLHYARELHALRDWCLAESVTDWSAIDSHALRRFIGQGHRRGLSGRSLQRRLSAIRSFFRFLVREGALQANPADGLSAPRSPSRLPATLDVDAVSHLLDAPSDEDDSLTVRDLALFELVYSSGLRLAETVGLDLSDLSLEQALVRVTGKGSKTRIVPVGRKAVDRLRDWLSHRDSLAAGGEQAVFVTRSGGRLSPRSVQQRLRRRASSAGLAVGVHPHMLRHAFATHMLESSGDLRALQELLGHADIGTTQIYTHLDFQHLAQVYDAAHPRARKKR